MTYRVRIGNEDIELFEDEANAIIRQIFAQKKIDTIETVLDRQGYKYTPEQVKQIADDLYEQIFEDDDMYWELEDKNIFYLAEKIGISVEG